jgi:hypothetical protein
MLVRSIAAYSSNYKNFFCLSSSTPVHAAIFFTNNNQLYIFALSPYNDYGTFYFDFMSNSSFLEPIDSVGLSQNGLHLFVATKRVYWELLSMERFYNTCTTLKNSTDQERADYRKASPDAYDDLEHRCNTTDYRYDKMARKCV